MCLNLNADLLYCNIDLIITFRCNIIVQSPCVLSFPKCLNSLVDCDNVHKSALRRVPNQKGKWLESSFVSLLFDEREYSHYFYG